MPTKQPKKLVNKKPSASNFKVGHVLTHNKTTFVVKTRAQPTGKRTKYWQVRKRTKASHMLTKKRNKLAKMVKLAGGDATEVVNVLESLADPNSPLMAKYYVRLQDGQINLDTFEQVHIIAAEMFKKYEQHMETKGQSEAYKRLLDNSNGRGFFVKDASSRKQPYARAMYIVLTHIAWFAKDYDRPEFLAPGNNVVHFEYASQDNILDAFQAHTTNLVGSVKQGLFAFKSTATFKDANTEKEMMVQFV
jgi:hypothetical protein